MAIYGTGEAAELAYLSLRELGLEPVAIFDADPGGRFLGMPVRTLSEHRAVDYDLLVVASLEHPGPLTARLSGVGVPRERMCTLRPHAP